MTDQPDPQWKVTTERIQGVAMLAIYHLAGCGYKATLHPQAPTLLSDVKQWHLNQCPLQEGSR